MSSEAELIKELLKQMKLAMSRRPCYGFRDELLAYGYYLVGCKAVELRETPYNPTETQKFFNNKIRSYRRALVRETKRTSGNLNDAVVIEHSIALYDLSKLTQRQQQIVKLKLAGYKSKEVAEELKISQFVVCWELDRIRTIIERQLS